MTTNPYATPRAVLAETSNDAAGAGPEPEISMAELEAFAGDAKYPRRWQAKHQGHARLAGFNLWAMLFGIQWFFYRRLYIQGAVSILLEVGVPVLAGTFIVSLIGRGQVAISLTVAAAIATRIGIGFWANTVLYAEALRAIREVDALNLDNEAHLREIARAGAVSVPSLLAAYVLIGALRLGFPVLW